jgi:SAM-dependent methyltransferase
MASIDAAQPDNPAFYDKHWQEADTSANPHVVAKGDLVVSLIPEGVRTIIDVGCGDGYLTHRLAERWDVTGVDRSAVALARLRCRAVQASADALPFPDGAADLLFSSEMLEHLPDSVYERAIREMARVASRYLLISVPHRETLRRRFARCPRCRLEFHIDGHLRSLDEAAIDRAFPAFRRVRTELSGPFEPATFAPIEEVRQRVARRWFVWDGAKITCPRCGETRFRKLARTRLHEWLDGRLDQATRLVRRFRGVEGAPYWMITLLERRS